MTRRRVLLTGMSGTGKSTLLRELARRGWDTVDADGDAWSSWQDVDGEPDWVWDAEAMTGLLAVDGRAPLAVAGCSPGQGRFYDRFTAVVLLSAPADVLLARILARTDNPFGRTPAQRAKVLADLTEVEPLLRAGASHELDSTRPVAELADAVEAISRA